MSKAAITDPAEIAQKGISKVRQYSDDSIAAAKALYMDFIPLRKISAETGIKVTSIKYYIGRYWKEEREAKKSEMIEALTESKRAMMFEISKNGLKVLSKGLEDLANSTRKLTPAEMKQVESIITNIDKIVKLDDGNPTDIIDTMKPATVVEVREILKKDPFLGQEIEDVDFKQIGISPDSSEHDGSGVSSSSDGEPSNDPFDFSE